MEELHFNNYSEEVGMDSLIAYIDESGDTGNIPSRSSMTYTLGCVLVNASEWNGAFDELINFRRRLNVKFKIPVRTEIKANYLIRSSGTFTNLGLAPTQRSLVYKAHLTHMAQDSRLRAFSVVVHKTMQSSPSEVFVEAWKAMLQRLESTSRNTGGCPVVLMHDEGNNDEIRKLARWSRRRMTAGSMMGTATRSVHFQSLIDDPIPKASHESYFLQLADLVAYSAFRKIHAPSVAIASVVQQDMWNNLGRAVFGAANGNRVLTAPGIVEIWK